MVVESPSAGSKTKFRYSKWKVASIAFITLLTGGMLLLVPVAIISLTPRDTVTLPLILLALIVGGVGLYVLLWGFNFFWVTFEVGDRGLRYTTLFSKRIIPWENISGIKRAHFFGAHNQRNLASAPPDLTVHTKDGKSFFILNLMKKQDFDLLLSQIKEKTRWADEKKVWQRDVLRKLGIGQKVVGVVMVVTGIFFPRMYEFLHASHRHDMEIEMKLIDVLVKILSVNGLALLIVGFGVYLLVKKPKLKNLNK